MPKRSEPYQRVPSSTVRRSNELISILLAFIETSAAARCKALEANLGVIRQRVREANRIIGANENLKRDWSDAIEKRVKWHIRNDDVAPEQTEQEVHEEFKKIYRKYQMEFSRIVIDYCEDFQMKTQALHVINKIQSKEPTNFKSFFIDFTDFIDLQSKRNEELPESYPKVFALILTDEEIQTWCASTEGVNYRRRENIQPQSEQHDGPPMKKAKLDVSDVRNTPRYSASGKLKIRIDEKRNDYKDFDRNDIIDSELRPLRQSEPGKKLLKNQVISASTSLNASPSSPQPCFCSLATKFERWYAQSKKTLRSKKVEEMPTYLRVLEEAYKNRVYIADDDVEELQKAANVDCMAMMFAYFQYRRKDDRTKKRNIMKEKDIPKSLKLEEHKKNNPKLQYFGASKTYRCGSVFFDVEFKFYEENKYETLLSCDSDVKFGSMDYNILLGSKNGELNSLQKYSIEMLRSLKFW